MIKSSKVSLKFANSGKQETLVRFVDEYQRVTSQIIDLLWDFEKVPKFIPKEITDRVETWLSARAVQAAGKQASGIVRGTRKKSGQRKWRIENLRESGHHKKARKLERIHNSHPITKPHLKSIQPELDSRFVEMDFNNPTTFDGWIIISSIGDRTKISIPVKKHKHFNKLNREGILKGGVRLSKHSITFLFEMDKTPPQEEGIVLGIDVGVSSLISCSNGYQSTSDGDGHDLSTISKILSRKRKGSKGFHRTQTHRTNYINQTVNLLDLTGVQEVRLENIKNLRKGRISSRFLSHWPYPEIFEKLETHCSESGVLVKKVNPTYTSQRCSACGWTRRTNRKGKMFKCGSCGFTHDADLNASWNIHLNLRPIGKLERLQQNNRLGFYWLVEGQEKHIVPDVQKP